MELYYAWDGKDLEKGRRELAISQAFAQNGGRLTGESPYINEVLKADLVVDFSGDIWGANADFLGPDRFEIGLIKDRVAQLLGKPTAMIAGSPGPFSNVQTMELARCTYSNFVLVTNREDLSKRLLQAEGFDTSKTFNCACPAFLFEPTPDQKSQTVLEDMRSFAGSRPLVGFVVCGWNFGKAPFDRWPREDVEFAPFVDTVRQLVKRGAAVACLSHSNGFDVPPAVFRLKHGRDFPIAERIHEMCGRVIGKNSVFLCREVLTPGQTKAVIGGLDFLVSGRVHAAVAGLSQGIPTAIIDYGHEPRAHKLRGFARVAEVEDCVVDPNNSAATRIADLFEERHSITHRLAASVPKAKSAASKNFELLRKALPA